jgi:hypothetical protein
MVQPPCVDDIHLFISHPPQQDAEVVLCRAVMIDGLDTVRLELCVTPLQELQRGPALADARVQIQHVLHRLE